ncbi:MAG: hypothetical protein RI907_1526 [Pseudomonadota bacterium]
MTRLSVVYDLIQTDYVLPMDGAKVMSACMSGMVRSLDAQSAYFDKDQFDDVMNPPADGVGIGVELALRAGLPTLITAMEGSPADKAGLRPRDILLEIDGRSMEETELQDAFKALRGKPGSKVALVIRRPGEATHRSLTLTREQVYVKSVSSSRAAQDVGYIRVRNFTPSTAPDVRQAFRQLQAARPLRGIVLDLRHSPGGLLTTAVELAAMLLPPGAPIGTLRGRLPESNQGWVADRDEVLRNPNAKRDAWPDELKHLPLVVLLNGGTASGAEFIAAALRDNDRAKLVGSKTFGRGSVQTWRRLDKDTAIKLTTAHYLSPRGVPVQGQGLTPDVQAPDPSSQAEAGSTSDPAMQQALALLQAEH